MMMMAAETGNSGSPQYIRKVSTSTDNFCIVLYYDKQLDLLLKYCGEASNERSPIHIDTTFNLTNYYALVTVFRATEFEGSPIVFGPILLTKCLKSDDYRELWDCVLRQKPGFRYEPFLFVTDGETAITNSIRDSFPLSSNFRCMLHLVRNVTDKATKLGVPSQLIKLITQTLAEHTDADPYEYLEEMEEAYRQWETMAARLECSGPLKNFLTYYKRNVSDVMITNNRIRSYDSDHISTQLLTNNPSESGNAILKNWCNGTKLPLDELVVALREGMQTQFEELKKAEIGISRKYIRQEPDNLDNTDELSSE